MNELIMCASDCDLRILKVVSSYCRIRLVGIILNMACSVFANLSTNSYREEETDLKSRFVFSFFIQSVQNTFPASSTSDKQVQVRIKHLEFLQ